MATISNRRRTMIAKRETTRGTVVAQPWANSDFDVPFYNIQISPEIAEYARIYALGDHDRLASVMGKRMANVTASVDLAWSGTNDTVPKISKVFDMLGFRRDVNVGTNVQFYPNKCGDLGGGVDGAMGLPYDLMIQDPDMACGGDVLGFIVRSALANANLVVDEGGQPIRADLEIMGVLESIFDIAAELTPSGLDTTLPDQLLSSTVELASVAQRIDTFTLNVGNVVELENDPSDASGYKAAYIAERNPTLQFNPLADLIANEDVWTQWKDSSELILQIATEHFTIDADKAQIITLGSAEQNSARAWDKTMSLNRDSSNGYPYIITHATV